MDITVTIFISIIIAVLLFTAGVLEKTMRG
jgi:hypothetical protein